MKYCSKCGNELNDDAKFCTKCGNLVSSALAKGEVINDSNLNPYKNSADYNNEDGYYDNKNEKKSKLKKILIISIIIAIVAAAIGSGAYFLTLKTENQKLEKSVQIKQVASDGYPTVSLIVECENFDSEVTSDNITVKEGDYFPKNVSVEKSGDDSRYLISYFSPNDNAGKNLTVYLEYTNGNDDIKCSTSYVAPELKSEKSGSTNPSLNTYDPNVEIIKSMYDNFIQGFTSMVNYSDISYTNKYVVTGSNLYNDFIISIESFKKQGITERLDGYTIQNIKRIDDNNYEVYVYESYYINYGKEHSSKIKTFNSIYTAQKSNGSFKFTDLKYSEQ